MKFTPVIVVVFSCCIVSFLLAGCDIEPNAPEKNETDFGSHHIVVYPGTESPIRAESSSEGAYYAFWRCGDTIIIFENEELIVGLDSYGFLKEGDSIEVNHGQVRINKENVSGKRLPEERQAKLGLVLPETIEEIAGHQVIARPGSAHIDRSDVLKTHILRIGLTTIMIKDETLSVNGRSYGKLKKKQKITINNEEVKILEE